MPACGVTPTPTPTPALALARTSGRSEGCSTTSPNGAETCTQSSMVKRSWMAADTSPLGAHCGAFALGSDLPKGSVVGGD